MNAPTTARLGRIAAHVVAGENSVASTGIPRRLPPPPNDEAAAAVKDSDALLEKCKALRSRMQPLADHPLLPDAGEFVKAVEWAVRFDEWYQPEDEQIAHGVLEEASKRLASLEGGGNGRGAGMELAAQTGLVVRGYKSLIDGSDQPYGLEVPDEAPPPAVRPKPPILSRPRWLSAARKTHPSWLTTPAGLPAVRLAARQRRHHHRPSFHPRLSDQQAAERTAPNARRGHGDPPLRKHAPTLLFAAFPSPF